MNLIGLIILSVIRAYNYLTRLQVISFFFFLTLDQECTNSGLQVTRATEFFTAGESICESFIRNLLYITLLR